MADAPDSWDRQMLADRVRALEARARLVSTRVLRRLIKQEQQAGPLAFHLIHRRSLTITPQSALRTVGTAELGLSPAEPLPDLLFLLECPDLPMTEAEALGWIWRRLFHARVHAAIDAKLAARQLDSARVDQRIAAIGRREFAEIRSVLDRDAWLLKPQDDASVYGEFVAVFLELHYFYHGLAAAYFPGISDLEAVSELIEQDVDGRLLFESTRPPAAPDPAPHPVVDDRPQAAPPTEGKAVRSEGRFRWVMARSDAARSTGNVVRSAILRAKAARLGGPSQAGRARSGMADDMSALARRLAEALRIESVRSPDFRGVLGSLLNHTDQGDWSVEARLLYDLQSVCIDHEREVFQLDLKGWLLSGGRRPLKRHLPNQTLIRMSKHLRKAMSRLPRSRLDESSRHMLTKVLQEAMGSTEEKLRDRFRPLVSESLRRANLRPANLPERISFDRMVEELLDRIVERDHLTMGEVRDAVARGDLRQPNLTGPSEFVRGDRVLRADRQLAVSLDGVYRPGEIYLRALQSASLIAFGTRVGRWLVRYVAVPYGGAVGALMTIQELLGFARIKVELTNRWTVGLVGTILLLLLHSRRVLAIASAFCTGSIRAIRAVLVDAPSWVLERPVVRALLKSRTFDLTRRWLLQPAICAAVTYAIVYHRDHDRRVATGFAVLVLALTAAFLGTSFGRGVEDAVTDAALRGWRRLRVDLLPGLARFILDLFAAILEGLDRLFYAVDEKLRFRSGEGRASLYLKAVVGALWGIVTYVIRIFINLLVEPTVNPLKHFPTVTVAAKMLIPYLEVLTHAMSSRLLFLGGFAANAVAWLLVGFLPGLAGFIVWELKENWKLFEANRPRTLQPVMIGHHGETMRRLLVPGFHSGTIPNLFAKLRRAERDAYRTGRHAAARKVHQAIEHVEVPIRHFVERGLRAILVESGRFASHELRLENIRLATNRVNATLTFVASAEHTLRITFENADGRLIAHVRDLGLLATLEDEQRVILDATTTVVAARAGAEELQGDFTLDNCPLTPPEPARHPAKLDEPRRGALIAISWRRWVDFWRGFALNGTDARPRTVADELPR